MPLLIYKCKKCGYIEEFLVYEKKKKIPICPDCKIKMDYIFSNFSYKFKNKKK